jgi:predicted SAM-dependent methyltransferase
MIQINLGCGKRNFGNKWIHIDGGGGRGFEHLDSNDIIDFPYNNVDLIYASHLIGYFNREEIFPILKKWKSKLKKNGVLRLATPNFAQIAKLYKKFTLNSFLGPLYGKMKMKNKIIYHKTCYDKDSLTKLLKKAGFRNIRKWNHKKVSHSNFDDHSQAYLPHMDKENGTLISLNLECIK